MTPTLLIESLAYEEEAHMEVDNKAAAVVHMLRNAVVCDACKQEQRTGNTTLPVL